jgi:potassium/chloride transporter 4/5/6
MHSSDISAYAVERTRLMEQRQEVLAELRVTRRNRWRMVDKIIERSRHNDLGAPAAEGPAPTQFSFGGAEEEVAPEEANVRRMHTAVRLNEAMVARSHAAQLVILNLPGPPRAGGEDGDSCYLEFLSVLTEGLERVLMVRGGGREVITIYS